MENYIITYNFLTFLDDLKKINFCNIQVVIKDDYINFINDGIKILKNFKFTFVSFEIYLENMDIFNKLYETINEFKLIKDFSLSIDICNKPHSSSVDYIDTIILHMKTDKLNNLPEYLCKLNLKCLNLGNNFLKEFPISICELKNLELLMLHKNNLSTIPKTIKNLTKLKMLDISENNFCEFPIDVCKLKNLERLYIDGNDIKKIPFEITKLTNLKTFIFDKFDYNLYDLQNFKNKRLVFRLFFLINKNNKILNFKIIKNILKY